MFYDEEQDIDETARLILMEGGNDLRFAAFVIELRQYHELISLTDARVVWCKYRTWGAARPWYNVETGRPF